MSKRVNRKNESSLGEGMNDVADRGTVGKFGNEEIGVGANI
jgi:hypothetical protein